MELLAFLGIAWSLVVTILWLRIGWRAMVAHETLTDRVSKLNNSMLEVAKAIKGTGEI